MATAAILRLPSRRETVKLDDGPRSIAFIQREIFASGKTYMQIAVAGDLSAATVYNIASGQTRRPAHATVVRIAMALGWTVYAERS